MFEVEQKFKLSDDQSKKLLDGADFVSEKTFTDVYYDTEEYSLTKNDIWLQKRGKEVELKIPMHNSENKFTQQYQEIEGEEKIREVFAIAPIADFETDIKVLGYEAFCECSTTRRKFKKQGFIIDMDAVEYGSSQGGLKDFSYEIAEIELLVETKEEMNEAAGKIEKFAAENGLEKSYVRGKVLEYLLKKKPEHYQALVEAGVVRR